MYLFCHCSVLLIKCVYVSTSEIKEGQGVDTLYNTLRLAHGEAVRVVIVWWRGWEDHLSQGQ